MGRATQFANAEAKSKLAELPAAEDLADLDQRRMEFGLMPIETYKAFMLKSVSMQSACALGLTAISVNDSSSGESGISET